MVVTRKRMVICDEDAAYVQALSTYIVSSINGIDITSYSEPERFFEDQESYDVALLGRVFLEILERDEQRKERYKDIFILTGDMNESMDSYRVIYKFQKMNTFLERLLQVGKESTLPERNHGVRPGWTGIFSPIRHELQLLFSLAYCKYKKEKEPLKTVLFLDLEENSLLTEFISSDHSKNITDYLYLLENEEISKEELLSCLSYTNGFAYLSPARYFQELLTVNEKQWETFFESIASLGFDEVIILFGDAFRGTALLMSQVEWLLLLVKDGDFYRRHNRQITSFIKKNKWELTAQEVNLPLSGTNLVKGGYRLENLLAGNLSQYALRALTEIERKTREKEGKGL